MEIITAAGRRVLERASEGTAMVLQAVSFFVVWKAIQIIINNIITNAKGFEARGINAVDYAQYDASWLVGQMEGIVSLRGEFFIIAFMNSAFQFLLSALIGYELAKTRNEWCPPFMDKGKDGKDLPFYFGPLSTLTYYIIPQALTKKSRHVHGKANHAVLTYVFLWIILAAIDIWSTTMFRTAVVVSEAFPTGLDSSLIPISIAMSILYNIVLAELALLISGGIAVATVMDIFNWLWGNGKLFASSAKKKPAVTVTNNEPRTPATNGGGQRNQQSTPAMPLRDKSRNSGGSQQPVVRSTPPIGNGRTPSPAFASPRSVDDLFSREGIRPTFEFGEED